VENLQNVDGTDILGLTSQSEIAMRLNSSQSLLGTLGSCLSKGASDSQISQSQILPMVQDVISKLPKDLSDDEIRERLSKTTSAPQTSPMSICLRFEMEGIHRLVRTVRRNLQDVVGALVGSLRASNEVDRIIDLLVQGLVPSHWGAFAPSLGGWLSSLLWRFDVMERWSATGRPKHLALAALFNPHAVIAAVRQEVARKKTNWSLEDIVTFVEVSKVDIEQIKDAPAEGFYASAFAMEHCACSTKEAKLVECPPKTLLSQAPILYFTACHVNDMPSNRDASTATSTSGKKEIVVNTSYECPVYCKQRRSATALLAFVTLKSDEAASRWTLKGSAIVPMKE